MIELINAVKKPLPEKPILNFISHISQKLKIKKIELSVVFVNKQNMKKINGDYRGVGQPTDVLSFCYYWQRGVLDGEIVICYEVAKAQAVEFKYSFGKELERLLTHSLLHLVGYDHIDDGDAAKMERQEKMLLKS